MKKNYKFGVVIVLVFAMFLAASTALAQDPVPTPSDDEVNEIAEDIYCPVCENITLEECPTAACADWREEIRDLLAQGMTKQEIYDYFSHRYGEQVLARPPRKGLNWILYIVAPLGFLVGIIVLVRGFRAWQSPVGALTEEAEFEDEENKDEYISRFEDELKKRQ